MVSETTVVHDVPETFFSSAGFADISPDQQREIWSRAKVRHLLHGEILVQQNTPADTLYVVIAGRFEVAMAGQSNSVAEIGVGQPIGEIGFFAGGLRTATVKAVRDSVVLELDRTSFDEVAHNVPAIYEQLLKSLARRVAETTAQVTHISRVTPPRTVAIISGGQQSVPPQFLDKLRSVFGAKGTTLFVTRELLNERFPGRKLDDAAVMNWLDTVEREFDLIVYLSDAKPTDWTSKAVRQADQVLIIVYGAATPPNPAESIAIATHPPSRRRLVRVHDRRASFVDGTQEWLRERDVFMHHHVALEDDLDFRSLYRFITGQAVGFVAGGGGGFGPAHVGIYKAFQERGAHFDILGGASAGAAMLAGFAVLLSPDEIDQAIRDVFVTSRGFQRRTFPRYAFLDHIEFDQALQRLCRGARIEDAWRPYFAVATDIDRAGYGPYLCRKGPLWKAVRASGSIPGVLPPMFTDDGRMLVDGGVVDNVPLAPMKALKSGPNLVVHFANPPIQPYTFTYESIPGRRQLLQRMLNPFTRNTLPDAPGPITILRRCFGVHQNPDLFPLGPLDLILAPPAFPGSSFIDFSRHREVFEASYQWCLGQIDELLSMNNPALAAILARDAGKSVEL
jgi:NTE family protein